MESIQEPAQNMTARRLAEFARKAELSGDYVRELTGVNISRYRRGRAVGNVELSPDALALLKRIDGLYSMGLALFADRQKALDWMHELSPTLGGVSPIDAVETEEGFTKIRAFTGAILNTTPAVTPTPQVGES